VTRGSGMSLVELIVVLLVLAVLLALAYPSWQQFRTHQALRYAAAQVASSLREAQERAKAERVPYRVSFTGGSGGYLVERDGGGFRHEASMPEGVSAEQDVVVEFTGFGRPVSEDGYRVRVRNGAGSAEAVVSPEGGIRYEAP